MIYAITYHEQQVFQHFGKCPAFLIVTIEDGKVLNKTELKANGVGHNALVDLLAQHDVHTLVCGGIGNCARTALMEHEIKLISGAKGATDTIIDKLIAGTLEDDPSGVCHHHHHDCK